jgi:WD40 repeat protein
VNAVAFSPDGLLLGTADGSIQCDCPGENNVKLWRLGDGTLERTVGGSGCGGMTALGFAPVGGIVVSGGECHTPTAWRVDDGSLVWAVGGGVMVSSAAVSMDSSLVALGFGAGPCYSFWEWDGGIQIVRTTDGSLVRTMVLEGQIRVLSASFSPDGSHIVTAIYEGMITQWGRSRPAQLWRVRDGALVRTYQAEGPGANCAVFSPDGTMVLTAHPDGTAKLWHAGEGTLVRTLQGHSDTVTSVAFSPDGTRVLTGSRDGTALVWDVVDVLAPPVLWIRRADDHVLVGWMNGGLLEVAEGVGRPFARLPSGTNPVKIVPSQMGFYRVIR